MSQNSNETRQGLTARSRVKRGVVRDASMPQGTDIPREGLSARPLVLITRGRIEYTAKCPGCGNWHRHRKLGDVEGPCGTTYELQPKAKRRAA